MKQLLHTPEGVRDVYGAECEKKLYLQEKLQRIFYSYGYENIETPGFEYFDVFGQQVGTIPSRELYKFFDREGNTLVPRPRLYTVHCPGGVYVFSPGRTSGAFVLSG